MSCNAYESMKQLDVVVSQSAFVCNPYLTLAHMTFDLNTSTPTNNYVWVGSLISVLTHVTFGPQRYDFFQ